MNTFSSSLISSYNFREKNDKKINELELKIINSDKIILDKSVVEIISNETYNLNGKPIEKGLFDLRLGGIDNIPCNTCNLLSYNCVGHFGHISLAKPCIHSGYLPIIEKILKIICTNCSRIQFLSNFTADNNKSYKDIFSEVKKNMPKKCKYCNEAIPKIKINNHIYFFINNRRVYPDELKDIFKKIPQEEINKLNFFKNSHPSDLILSNLLVPPTNVRPSLVVGNNKVENDLTVILAEIIKINNNFKLLNNYSSSTIINNIYDSLQYYITLYFNNNLKKLPLLKKGGDIPLKGLKQRIDSKEGRIRQNLLGKRVNHAARAVIVGDSSLSLDEISIPNTFKKEIIIEIDLYESNISDILKLIDASPNYPCIKYIEKNNRKIKVLPTNKEYIKELLLDSLKEENIFKNNIILFKSLEEDDYCLFNRQPSLHKHSIMAFKIKFNDSNTIKMNPLICYPFNADFDGDEMNLFFIQSKAANIEAKNIMTIYDNIISIKTGKCIIGFIQDYLTGGYLLSINKNIKYLDLLKLFIFDIKGENYKNKINDIIFNINNKNKTFTGLEIIALFLPDNFVFRDNHFFIENGKIFHDSLILKSNFGPENKIFEKIYKLYGAIETINCIENLGNLFLKYYNNRQLSLFVNDFIIPEEYKNVIDNLTEKSINLIENNNPKLEQEKYVLNNNLADIKKEELNIFESKIIDVISDNLKIFLRSGSAGSSSNIYNITSKLGQIFIKGDILQPYEDDKLLAYSNKYKKELRGYVSKGYLEGLENIELFVQAIASREALTDAIMVTASSGYLYRKMIYSLADLIYKNNLVINENNIIGYNYENNIDFIKNEYILDNYLSSLNYKEEINPLDDFINIINEKLEEYDLSKNILIKLLNYLYTHKCKIEDVDIIFKGYVENIELIKYNEYTPIGLFVTQSICEPLTQANLRAGHVSGSKQITIEKGLPDILRIMDNSIPSENIYYILPLLKDISDEEIKEVLEEHIYYRNIKMICNYNYNEKDEILYLSIKEEFKEIISLEKIISLLKKEIKTIQYKNENNLLEINIQNIFVNSLLKIKYSGLKEDAEIYYNDKEKLLYISQKIIRNIAGENILKKYFDIKNIYSNNIKQITSLYGVEYAKKIIYNIIYETLGLLGISIQNKYIDILSDLLTSKGELIKLGRQGLIEDKSILGKVIFETSYNYLLNSSLRNEKDDLKGVNSSVIIGNNLSFGSNKYLIISK